MLCAPFQCDYCWFINLKGREYDQKRASDRLNMSLIHRVNLDVFWDKETSTVEGMLNVFRQANTAALHLGITPSFLRTKQPWPIGDRVGFGEAMLLLWDSVQPVQRTGNSSQFDTIRKLRSMTANVQSTSFLDGMEGLGFKDRGNMFLLERCSTNLVLFMKFIKGCEKRMGRMVKQDVALSVPILLAIQDNLEQEFKSASTPLHRKRDLVMLGSFLMVGFRDALRGNEVFLVESANLCKYWEENKRLGREYVTIPMMGRFKGETGERNIMRVLVHLTLSGLQIGKWVNRLVRVLIVEGRNLCGQPGPAFCDEQGIVLSYSYISQ